MADAADPLVLGLLLAALVDSADLHFRMIRRRAWQRRLLTRRTTHAHIAYQVVGIGSLDLLGGHMGPPRRGRMGFPRIRSPVASRLAVEHPVVDGAPS